MSRLAVFLVCGFAIIGCNEPIHPEIVAKRWSETLSAFNIDPIFPPRHVQVGDIFLFLLPSGTPTPDFYSRRSLRLGRAEVRQMLMENMQTDLLLPVTGNNDSHTNIFNEPTEILSARPTAYPGFNLAQVTEADLGIAFPVKVFRAMFGIASSHDLAMSISIPQAEDIELPAYDAYDALSYYCKPNPSLRRCSLGTPEMRLFIHNLCLPSGELPNTVLTPWIVFVNHVFYARQINYAYTTKGGAALGVSVAMAAAASASGTSGNMKSLSSSETKSSSSDGKKSSSSSGNAKSTSSGNDKSSSPDGAKSSSSDSSTNTSEPQTEAEKEAKALKSELNEIQGSLGSAGGRLQVVVANSEGTLLSQTFNLPIAIGYRGLAFDVGPPATYCDISSQGAPHASRSSPNESVR